MKDEKRTIKVTIKETTFTLSEDEANILYKILCEALDKPSVIVRSGPSGGGHSRGNTLADYGGKLSDRTRDHENF